VFSEIMVYLYSRINLKLTAEIKHGECDEINECIFIVTPSWIANNLKDLRRI
jgi:hypothetical protein